MNLTSISQLLLEVYSIYLSSLLFLMLFSFNIKRNFKCTSLLIVNSVKVKSVTGLWTIFSYGYWTDKWNTYGSLRVGSQLGLVQASRVQFLWSRTCRANWERSGDERAKQLASLAEYFFHPCWEPVCRLHLWLPAAWPVITLSSIYIACLHPGV